MNRKMRDKIISLLLCLVICITGIDLSGFMVVHAETLNGFNVSLSLRDEESTSNVVVWNIEDNITKTLKMVVEYKNTSTHEGYEIGELKFVVPGLGSANRGSMLKATDVAANEDGSSEYAWNYTYNQESDIYTFTNAKEIKAGISFTGSFEIAYSFSSRDLIDGFTKELNATFSVDNKSIKTKDVQFSVNTLGDSYEIEETVKPLDGFETTEILNKDYIWVGYKLDNSVIEKSRGIESAYYNIELSNGAEVVFADYGNVFMKSGGVYRVDYDSDMSQSIVVKYPRDTYEETAIVENRVELWGIYLDESTDSLLAETFIEHSLCDFSFDSSNTSYGISESLIGNSGTYPVKFSKLTDGVVESFQINVIARNNDVDSMTVQSDYMNDLYYLDELDIQDLLKDDDFFDYSVAEAQSMASEVKLLEVEELLYLGLITEDDYEAFMDAWLASGSNSTFKRATDSNAVVNIMEILATSSNATPSNAASDTDIGQDVYIGSDFIDIGSGDTYRVLEDYEYSIATVQVPSVSQITNASGYKIDANKYTASIILGRDRYAEPYASYKIGTSSRTVKLPDGTNAVWLRIDNVEESIYVSSLNLSMKFTLDESLSTVEYGVIRSLSTLIVEKDGEVLNIASEDEYGGDDAERIYTRDMDTYSQCIQRGYSSFSYETDAVNTFSGVVRALAFLYPEISLASAESFDLSLEKTVETGYSVGFEKNFNGWDYQDIIVGMGEEYAYRLSVEGIISSMTTVEHLVVYDILETADFMSWEYGIHRAPEWQGYFLGTDTSCLDDMGYNDYIVWYNPYPSRSLTSLDDPFSQYWSTDPSMGVASIAIEFPTGIRSGDYLYVDVIMESPYDDKMDGMYAVNGFSVEWSGYDDYGYKGNEDYYDPLESNNVNIRLWNGKEPIESGEIYLTIMDSKTGNPIGEAVYDLYDSNGDLVYTDLYTSWDGTICIAKIPEGEYYFQQSRKIDDYELSDERIYFIVDSTNYEETQWFYAYLRKLTGELRIDKKIDTVYSHYGNPNFIYEIVSMDKGRTYCRNINLVGGNLEGDTRIELPVGEYEVREIDVQRFKTTDISPVRGNIINSDIGSSTIAVVEIQADDYTEILFTSELRYWDKYSHVRTGSWDR